ncbi:MAG TPA: RNA polymerase sigma factor [Gemmatimonadaceae bacterium]|nr:RNA polymerase sigma factor [Gemmatimonadaceae bacterium]
MHAFHPLHEFHALRVPPPQYPELIGADTDELSVVLRFVDGDRLAFEHLLALYWRPVLAFSTRLLHDGEAADDVAQETFLRLWVNRAGIQPEQLRAYIFRVARNLVIDETRRRSLRARAIDTAGLPPDTQRPDQVAERGEQHDAIQHAIDALPPRRREAFILAYLHELSYKEAAVVLDVSPATVKNHVAMALVDLRRSLARHAHPCA